MSRHDHAAVRERENSKLLVKWVDAQGTPFIEQTETHDISETGISFFLKTPIWVDTHLTLKVASSPIFGRLHSTTAKVVRVQTLSGRQLVGARFDD